ncbi:hypothetical protein ACJZ2D_002388 [Fusarium nematophilum]
MTDTTHSCPLPSAHRILTGSRRESKEDIQPWTAARCQRLLRQLQCRLVSLRKLINETRQSTSSRSKRQNTNNDHTQRVPKRARYTYGRRHSAPAQTKTPTRTPSTPPRLLRTLGAMKIERCSPGSGRVDFTTPLLRKFREQPTMTDSLCSKPEPTTASSPSLIADLQFIRRIVPEDRYRIYEAIFNWLSGLLRSTEPLSQISHSKSLLSMCLRKLVVRAHALSLLAGAVSEGLFEPPFVRLLAEFCLSLECSEEASRLVSSLNCPLAAPCSSSGMLVENSLVQPLGVIVRSLHGQGRFGAAFECLTGLFRSKRLPLTWLTLRKFKAVWTRGIEVMTNSSPAPSVVDFMCTAIDHLALHEDRRVAQEQDTEERTLVSVLAALAAAAWTLGADLSRGRCSQRKHAARRMLHVVDHCVARRQRPRGAFRSHGLFTLVLARFMATAMIDSAIIDPTAKQMASQEYAKLLTAGNGVPSQTQYRQTLLMACSVAQYRGQACNMPCHDVLSEICTTLHGLGLPGWFQDGLKSDGAFVLAQKTKDLRDIAFAERLHVASKEVSTMFSGWRWEEGISEWVLPSPVSEAGNNSIKHDDQELRMQRGTDRRRNKQENAQDRGTSLRWNSAVQVMDMGEEEDSGDELASCGLMEVHTVVEARAREGGFVEGCTRDPRGNTNRGNRRARSIKTVEVQRIKRAGSTRTRPGTGSERRLGRGIKSQNPENVERDEMPTELDWEDELGMS